MKTWYIAGLLLLVSYGLCAYGDIEEAADEFMESTGTKSRRQSRFWIVVVPR